MKRKVIFITDGDEYASRAVKYVAKKIGGRCILKSQGNPTILTGKQIVKLILQTPYDPVLVMFDDSGVIYDGLGEIAMKYVAEHEEIEVIGALAVASNTHHREWTRVNVSIDSEGNLTEYGVDKNGMIETEFGRISGDTVYMLDLLSIPFIVGIGDIGKMGGRDDVKKGAPITLKAIQLIIERNNLQKN